MSHSKKNGPGWPARSRATAWGSELAELESAFDRLLDCYGRFRDRSPSYRMVSKRPVAEYGTVKLPITEPTVTSPATR